MTIEDQFEECEAPEPKQEASDIEDQVQKAAAGGRFFIDSAVSISSLLVAKAVLVRDFFNHLPDECYCQNDEDTYELARQVARCVGLKLVSEKLTDEDAVSKGEEFMKRSVAEYAAWLSDLLKVDSRIAMFCPSLNKKTKKMERIGTSVIVPMKENSYERFVDGDLHEKEISSKDVKVPSSRMMFHAFGEARKSEIGKTKNRLQIVQFRTVMFQIASFCPSIVEGGRPTMVTFNAIPESAEKALQYGFEYCGKKLAGQGFDLMEIRPYDQRPNPPSFRASFLYDTMVSLLKHVQLILEED